jgi:hypothetical protein
MVFSPFSTCIVRVWAGERGTRLCSCTAVGVDRVVVGVVGVDDERGRVGMVPCVGAVVGRGAGDDAMVAGVEGDGT